MRSVKREILKKILGKKSIWSCGVLERIGCYAGQTLLL